jgi:hypothetical protein
MKNLLFISCAIFFTSVISCKKETVPAIIGQWRNTAIYTDPAQGGHGWETVTRFNEIVTFEPDSKFRFITDVPGSRGIYIFNPSSKDLRLNFENDPAGNVIPSETRKVESMSEDQLIITFVSPVDGMFYKSVYSRIN